MRFFLFYLSVFNIPDVLPHPHLLTIDEPIVIIPKLTVDELIVDELTVDELTVDELTDLTPESIEEDFICYPEILLSEYTLDVEIRNRYVVNTLEVKVVNLCRYESDYEFAVDLEEHEFISSLVMTIGNRTTVGKVKRKEEAEKDFKRAKEQGKAATLVTKSEKESNSFLTVVSIPGETTGLIKLKYEVQLTKNKNGYNYETKLKTYGEFGKININVNINETRTVTARNITIGDDSISDLTTPAKFNYQQKKFDKKILIFYDVERPTFSGGDIIINNGYFIHFMAPDDLPPLEKEILFLIDRSGSMWGNRIKQTQEAMKSILDQMKSEENITTFKISSFSYTMTSFEDNFMPVNDENIKKSKEFVETLRADGSTYMKMALEKSIRSFSHKNNTKLLFFLSDGYPTDSRWPEIHSLVKELNSDFGVIIFSIGIGSGAPYDDFETLSLSHNGVARQVFENIDIKYALSDFYTDIAMPVVNNIKCKYSNSKKSICSNSNLFRGQEFFSISELKDCSSLPRLETANDVLHDVEVLSNDCKVKNDGETDLERMFAYMQIQEWMKQLRYKKKSEEELINKIINFSLKYQFVTKFTSLVVVDEKIVEEPIEILYPLVDVDSLSIQSSSYVPGYATYHPVPIVAMAPLLVSSPAASSAYSYMPIPVFRKTPQASLGPTGHRLSSARKRTTTRAAHTTTTTSMMNSSSTTSSTTTSTTTSTTSITSTSIATRTMPPPTLTPTSTRSPATRLIRRFDWSKWNYPKNPRLLSLFSMSLDLCYERSFGIRCRCVFLQSPDRIQFSIAGAPFLDLEIDSKRNEIIDHCAQNTLTNACPTGYLFNIHNFRTC